MRLHSSDRALAAATVPRRRVQVVKPMGAKSDNNSR